MSRLYIITGPAGVGKSTVSKKIAESKDKSVLIEGDDIYHQVIGGYIQAWKSGNHLDTFWKVCFETIKIYLQEGFDVIFNYIVTPKDLKLIKECFYDYEIKFVVLLTDENTLISRDSKRPIDSQMGQRCLVLLNNFKNVYCDFINLLDTTNLSIDEVVYNIEFYDKFIL